MSKNNTTMFNYDISIMKKNVSKLMSENGITQGQLAESVGMSQSRISKILNSENSDCFTLEQLIAIAGTFHTSTDRILGLVDTSNIDTEENEITLSDICTKLFEINELAPLKISESDSEQTTVCIYFDNEPVNRFLREWNDVENMHLKNDNTKEKMINMWKTETIKENSNRFKKWKFKNKHEYQKYLLMFIAKNIGALLNDFPNTQIILPDDAYQLISEYYSSKEYIEDFLPIERKKLDTIMEDYLTTYSSD